MTSHRSSRTLVLLLVLTLVAACKPQADCVPAAPLDAEAEKQAIRDVIARMEAAWNRGDFRGYMQGFADHYVRDYGSSAQTRGTLHFFDIKIEMLGPDAAQLISRYQLNRPEKPQDGINTRLMRKRAGQWVIALNHVSSREASK